MGSGLQPCLDISDTAATEGLSLAGCQAALRGPRAIAAMIEVDPALLTAERWPDLRRLVLDAAVGVDEVHHAARRAGAYTAAVAALATDWMAGRSMEELRTVHGAALGSPDPLKFAQQLDRIVVNDLAWVLSAVVQLLAAEVPEPLPTPLTAMPAIAKYGVGTPAACFAASIGVRNRRDAHTLGELSPAARGGSFSDFLAWVGTLTPGHLARHVTPETAAMFLDRAATLNTPRDARDLVLSEEGSILVELRGIGPLGTADAVRAVAIDDELALEREHGDTTDRNAIAVRSASGVRPGHLAREHARVLAPLLYLEGGPVVRARRRCAWPTDPGAVVRGTSLRTAVRMLARTGRIRLRRARRGGTGDGMTMPRVWGESALAATAADGEGSDAGESTPTVLIAAPPRRQRRPATSARGPYRRPGRPCVVGGRPQRGQRRPQEPSEHPGGSPPRSCGPPEPYPSPAIRRCRLGPRPRTVLLGAVTGSGSPTSPMQVEGAALAALVGQGSAHFMTGRALWLTLPRNS